MRLAVTKPHVRLKARGPDAAHRIAGRSWPSYRYDLKQDLGPTPKSEEISSDKIPHVGTREVDSKAPRKQLLEGIPGP